MVAMVKPDNKSAEQHIESGCPLPEARIVNGTVIHGNGTYEWDATTQGVILGGESMTGTMTASPDPLLQPSSTATHDAGPRW